MIHQITLHSKNLRSNIKSVCFVIVLFSSFGIDTLAQDKSEKQLFTTVISDIEKRFPFQFTFANDIIENVTIIPPKDGLTFKQTLNYLEKNTNLVFTILANNFVSINRKSVSLIICGEIKDVNTNNPIQDVTIQGTHLSTISNSHGYFELELTGEEKSITIDHLGYQTIILLTDSFQKDNCTIIYMQLEPIDLQEIILKNYITKGISKTSGGGFKIDYSDFGTLPGLIEADVLQTIQALPGVQSADETVSNINVRGGTHDQNLILWDGIKMYQSGHFFGLISVFNPNITSKATLIKNGSNTEHTDGVSGTIIMNSDTEVNPDFSASIGVNMINVDAFGDVPIGKRSSLQLSTRKSISEFLKTPTYSRYFDRISQDSELDTNNEETLNSDIEFDFYDANLRWNYEVSDKNRIRVNFLVINNDLVFTENTTINSVPISRQSNISQSSIAGGIWYERDWSENFKSSLQIYETDYKLKSTNANLQQAQRFLQKNEVSETGIKLNTFYNVNKNITLQNGYQFIETGITNLNDIDTPVFIEQQIRVLKTHGLFSQASYKTKDRATFLSLGIRYNYNDKFKTHILEPRISYNQRLGEYINMEILGEFKHQNTSQVINFQNDFLGIEKRRWILANEEDVPVIKSKQASLGLQYKRLSWLVTIEGYYKIIKGIIAKSQGFQNQYEFVKSIGDYNVNGIEFLINKRFMNISTWLSYSYANNRYAFNDFEEREFPNNIDIMHAITWGGSYSFKGFKISTGLNWNSGLPTTRPLISEPVANDKINYDRANSSNLKEYFRVDLSAVYDFKLSKKIKAHTGVSIWNITDNSNTINNYYSLNQENVPQEMIKSTLGVTPNVIFRILF